MAINSKQKGARGEREFSNFLKERGIGARRSQQYCGEAGDADVITDLETVHFEVKRVERLQLYDAMEQAKRDCQQKKIPIVAHKKNRGEWLAVLPMDTLLRILKQGGMIEVDNPLLNLH